MWQAHLNQLFPCSHGCQVKWPINYVNFSSYRGCQFLVFSLFLLQCCELLIFLINEDERCSISLFLKYLSRKLPWIVYGNPVHSLSKKKYYLWGKYIFSAVLLLFIAFAIGKKFVSVILHYIAAFVLLQNWKQRWFHFFYFCYEQ